MVLTALVVFVGGTAWTVLYSFTNSSCCRGCDSSVSTSTSASGPPTAGCISIENLAIYGL